MKNSTKILIIIISIIIVIPIVIAFYCRHRVQSGNYDRKFVSKQTQVIPNIHTLCMNATPENELVVFADGSSKDTLSYFSAWRFGFVALMDSIPHFSVHDGNLNIESTFKCIDSTLNIDPAFMKNHVNYSFGTQNLDKIVVNQSKLYFYNSSSNCIPKINIEITGNGQCIAGETYQMRTLTDLNKTIPDSNMLHTYKNMDIWIADGTFEIKDYTNIDTLFLHAADERARIIVGNHIKIKHIEGELKSMSLIKGNFENIDLFRKILSQKE